MAAIAAAEAIRDAVWSARHRLGPHRDVLTPVVSVVGVAAAAAAVAIPVLFHRG